MCKYSFSSAPLLRTLQERCRLEVRSVTIFLLPIIPLHCERLVFFSCSLLNLFLFFSSLFDSFLPSDQFLSFLLSVALFHSMRFFSLFLHFYLYLLFHFSFSLRLVLLELFCYCLPGFFFNSFFPFSVFPSQIITSFIFSFLFL